MYPGAMPTNTGDLQTVAVLSPGCDCPGRRIPLHMVREVLLRLQKAKLDPDEPVQTWRCLQCGQIVVLLAKHLRIVA